MVQDTWNFFDLIEYTFGTAWFILRLIPSYFGTARIVLGFIAIPQAQGMLRFLSFYKPLGELIIIFQVLVIDLVTFLVVYLISIFGFGTIFLPPLDRAALLIPSTAFNPLLSP